MITVGDSGIGRAVAYAREGADVVISSLSEHDDAEDTAQLVARAGRRAVLIAGDVSGPEHCRDIIQRAVDEFGRVDILVSNAAPYPATKAPIANFAARVAGMLGERGIRVNSVAPGPIWTPLIPATLPEEKVRNFGRDTPLGRAGQPAVGPVYVLLASDEGSYISAAGIAVTGGRPVL